jgi:AAA domain
VQHGIAVSLVDTVERLQGGEKPTIIVSGTESDPHSIGSAASFNLNRANVAFSRTQQRLIVVCAETLLDHILPELQDYESKTAQRFPRASISSKLSTAGWIAGLPQGHSSKSRKNQNHRLPSRPRAPCAAIRNGRVTRAARRRTPQVFPASAIAIKVSAPRSPRSGSGHFETKSEAASLPVYWSGPPTELTFSFVLNNGLGSQPCF